MKKKSYKNLQENIRKLKTPKIDVWENKHQARKYRIKLIPTQIFFDAFGRELFRHEGFFSKEDILSKWKELGIELQKPEITDKATQQRP